MKYLLYKASPSYVDPLTITISKESIANGEWFNIRTT